MQILRAEMIGSVVAMALAMAGPGWPELGTLPRDALSRVLVRSHWSPTSEQG